VAVIAAGRPVELILPASRRVVLDRVRTALGSLDVRLATEGEVERYFPGTEPGAIPALRHWEGVELLMDDAMRVEGDIVLQGGRTETRSASASTTGSVWSSRESSRSASPNPEPREPTRRHEASPPAAPRNEAI
jgi:hypothetical protein